MVFLNHTLARRDMERPVATEVVKEKQVMETMGDARGNQVFTKAYGK